MNKENLTYFRGLVFVKTLLECGEYEKARLELGALIESTPKILLDNMWQAKDFTDTKEVLGELLQNLENENYGDAKLNLETIIGLNRSQLIGANGCKQNWIELEDTSSSGAKYCVFCDKLVYLTESEKEYFVNVAAGQNVATTFTPKNRISGDNNSLCQILITDD
jgi:hypothetical protein